MAPFGTLVPCRAYLTSPLPNTSTPSINPSTCSYSPPPHESHLFICVAMDLTEQEANYFESLPPPTGPSPFGLKPKKPSARPRSNSLRLKSSPYKVPSSLTGPPSPSRTSRSTPDLRWFSRSRKTKSVHSHPLSFSAPLPSNHTDTRSNPFSLRPPSVNWDGFGPGSSAQKQAKTSLWAAIRKAGVPIYLDTPGFDSKPRPLHRTCEIICRPFLSSVLSLSFRTGDILFAY